MRGASRPRVEKGVSEGCLHFLVACTHVVLLVHEVFARLSPHLHLLVQANDLLPQLSALLLFDILTREPQTLASLTRVSMTHSHLHAYPCQVSQTSELPRLVSHISLLSLQELQLLPH